MSIVRRLGLLLSVLVLVIITGTVGFMLVEHLSFLDALYFTVATVATVGYGDIHPQSPSGKVLAIVLIVSGVGTFSAFFFNAAGFMIDRRQDRLRRERLNTLIELFYSEVGNRLLAVFCAGDPECGDIRGKVLAAGDWSAARVAVLRREFEQHKYAIDRTHAHARLPALKEFLQGSGDILVHLLENPSLDEHEPFTEALRATFHLREELALRTDFAALPDSDIAHLTGDAQRCYGLLARRWVPHMHHLKTQYPYLFSLALRTNPFNEDRSPIVR